MRLSVWKNISRDAALRQRILQFEAFRLLKILIMLVGYQFISLGLGP